MNSILVRKQIKYNYNIGHLTWLKVGGAAEIFFKAYSIEDLLYFLNFYDNKLITIIGAGSNILIRDKGIDGTVIKLVGDFTKIALLNNNKYIFVGAGCLNYNFVQFCIKHSIAGFEFLVGIPGTIGGGVSMNAGAYSKEFKDIIFAVKVIDFYGKIYFLLKNEIEFKYRFSNLLNNFIVVGVIFKVEFGNQSVILSKIKDIQYNRYLAQPINSYTAGSTFKNPSNIKAWQLIENAGLKNLIVGGATISSKHSNFLINNGTASAKDIEDLGETIRKKVFQNSNVMLEWEIQRIGNY